MSEDHVDAWVLRRMPRPGETVDGRYRLLTTAKVGGAGTVYRAIDIAEDLQVALKVLNLGAEEAGLIGRFTREAGILSRCHHRHVVKLLGKGMIGHRQMYLVFEWLEGSDLSEAQANYRFTEPEVLRIGYQLADCLDVVHSQSVVHRDIKPANIFLVNPDAGIDVRLLDFGAARTDESFSESLTRTGAILGTPSYMAPEQATAPEFVDERADLYSLGVVFFELLTGRLPWSMDTDLARLARISFEDAQPLKKAKPGVDPAIARLVDSLLARDPKRRIQTAADLREQVLSLLEEADITERRFHSEDSEFLSKPMVPTSSSSLEEMVGDLPDDIPIIEEGFEHPAADGLGNISNGNIPLSRPDSFASLSAVDQSLSISEDDIPSVEELQEIVQSAAPLPELSDDDFEEDELDSLASYPLPYPTTSPEAVFSDHHDKEVDTTRPLSREEKQYLKQQAAAVSAEDNDDDIGSTQLRLDAQQAARVQVRSHVLEALETRILQAVQNAPTLIKVIGPPGSGKTRLRRRLARQLSDTECRLWSGTICPTFSRRPYGALVELIREFGQLPESQPTIEELQALLPSGRELLRLMTSEVFVASADNSARLSAFDIAMPFDSPTLNLASFDDLAPESGPDNRRYNSEIGAGLPKHEPLPTRLLPELSEEEVVVVSADILARLFGVPSEPSLLTQQVYNLPRLAGIILHNVLVSILRKWVLETGVVLLLDDAHFLDVLSARVFSEVGRSTTDSAFCVVAFASKLPVESKDACALPVLYSTEPTIELQALSLADVRSLLKAWLGERVSEETIAIFGRKSGQNPLLLEQLLYATARDSGFWVSRTGSVRLTELQQQRLQSVNDEKFSLMMTSALETRLSTINESLLEVLASAAVLGLSFSLVLLSRLLEKSLEEVRVSVGRLEVLGLVRSAESSYDSSTWRQISHEIVRGFVLKKLSNQNRRQLEAKVATLLVDEDREPIAIARHHLFASETEQAAHYYLGEAQRSFELGLFGLCKTLAADGLIVAVDGSIRARLAELLFESSLIEKNVESAEASLEHWRRAGDAAEVELAVSRLAIYRGRPSEAGSAAEKAAIVAKKLENMPLQVEAELSLATAKEYLGQRKASLKAYRLAYPSSSAHIECRMEAGLGLIRWAIANGEYRAANEYNTEIRELLNSGPEPLVSVQVLLQEIELSRVLGYIDHAESTCEAIRKQILEPEVWLQLQLAEISLMAERGRFAEAMQFVDLVYPHLQKFELELNAALIKVRCLRHYESFRLHSAQLKSTRKQFDSAIHRARMSMPVLVPPLELGLGLLEWLRGEPSEAAERVRRVSEQIEADGFVYGEEFPGVDLVVGKMLSATGGSQKEIHKILMHGISRLDRIVLNLDAEQQSIYLSRFLPQALVDFAVQEDVAEVQDSHCFRILQS